MNSQGVTNNAFHGRTRGRSAKLMVREKVVCDSLKSDSVVVVPTETVEGYAVALSSENGIRELMRIKERDFDSGKVFTLVPESKEAIKKYVVISERAQKLIDKYIPGEITLILPKNPDFHHFYYDHYDTIGIRIPNHPLFEELLPKTGALLLTSANPRGGTPKSFTGHRPSTIVDLTGGTPKIVRQGELVVEL